MSTTNDSTFTANGTTYTVKYGNRALRIAEAELGKSLVDIDFSSMQAVTVLLWAGLRSHHPSISLEDVDEIIDALGYERVAKIAESALLSLAKAKTEST